MRPMKREREGGRYVSGRRMDGSMGDGFGYKAVCEYTHMAKRGGRRGKMKGNVMCVCVCKQTMAFFQMCTRQAIAFACSACAFSVRNLSFRRGEVLTKRLTVEMREILPPGSKGKRLRTP
jgi:hypothetical protein